MDKLFLDIMFTYVFSDCCSCSVKECVISGIEKISPKLYNKYIKKNTLTVPDLDRRMSGSTCKLNYINGVNTPYFKNKNFVYIIEFFIGNFEMYNLIVKKNNKYFLLGGVNRFTWKNIKDLNIHYVKSYFNKHKDECTSIYNFFNDKPITENNFVKEDFELLVIYIKYIFWYFRKIIVDTLNSAILQNTQVISLSVGSTKLDSDYDITLYGTYGEIKKVINTFNKKFEEVFYYNSDIIFDTNIYGVSYITSNIDNPGLDKYSCGDSIFSIIETPNTDYYPITQNIWAFVKTFMKLNKLQNEDEALYSIFKDTLYDSDYDIYIKILKKAEQFVEMIDSRPDKYYQIVNLLELNTKEEHNIDYISYVNYNGNETYLTRGAFLDVVVNTQMCNKNYIQLTQSEYFDSFVENITDLMSHYKKDKYTTRVKNAIKNLNIENEDILHLLDSIETIQKGCTKDLIKCTKNLFIYDCISILKNVSLLYFKNISYDKLLNGLMVFNNFMDIISKANTNTVLSTYDLNEK